MYTKASLIAFEDRVKLAFLNKLIYAPIHLSGGNEDELIDIFQSVRPHDWVFSTWRSHYHALLHGIPESQVFDQIISGRSMYLMDSNHKFLCSSIVGGILPIACGVALGAKKLGLDEVIWVFVGDMCARTGIFFEFVQYWKGHELPIRVIIENNGLSTNTPTEEVWGCSAMELARHGIIEYEYKRNYPHVGIGQHVEF